MLDGWQMDFYQITQLPTFRACRMKDEDSEMVNRIEINYLTKCAIARTEITLLIVPIIWTVNC